MGSVVSIPAPAVTRGTPGTKKGRPAASPLPTINPGPWDHVCFRFWGHPHVPSKKGHCSHGMRGVQVLWAVPRTAGWCAHPLPAPLPMRLVHQGPSPCAWPARGPDVPAVDHDGPGVRGVGRPHFLQELEHPDGGERHPKVGPAGEVQLAHEPRGFAAIGQLLRGRTRRCAGIGMPALAPPGCGSPGPTGREGAIPGDRATQAVKPDACSQLWAPTIAVHKGRVHSPPAQAPGPGQAGPG